MMLVQNCTRCARRHQSVEETLQCLRSERPSSEWRQYWPVPTRFRLDEPAFVYLMTHPALDALKIGVTSDKRDDEDDGRLVRVGAHVLNGWEELRTWFFPLGYDALDCEELVLDRWNNLYSSRSPVDRSQMPQGGSSETTRDSEAARTDTIEFVTSFALAAAQATGQNSSPLGVAIEDPARDEFRVEDGWPDNEVDNRPRLWIDPKS